MIHILLGLFFTLSVTVRAEETAQLGGWLDFRPSFNASEDSMHSENEVALEYRLREDRAVGYTQEFFVRFNQAPDSGYYRSRFGDGYVWADFAKVASFGPVTVGYEPRLYFPTSGIEQETGLQLATRQILKVDWQWTPYLSLSVWEIPILASHQAAGFEGEDETLYANYFFENRIEGGPVISLFDEALKISLTVVYQARRHRDYDPEAESNNAWSYSLWFAPEILAQVTDTLTVGAAYYSDTFLGDLSGGLDRGTFQMILQQTL